LTAFIAALFLILNLAQAVLLKNANTEVLFTDEEIQEATKTTEIPVE
jgi:preprotein translocase subunit SecG